MATEADRAPAGETQALADNLANQPAGEPALEAPDAAYTRQRWVPQRTVEWVRAADEILMEHGAVQGRVILEKRYQARWRAQRLIRLMVELRLHHRWELREHTEPRPGGWGWSVEYLGGDR